MRHKNRIKFVKYYLKLKKPEATEISRFGAKNKVHAVPPEFENNLLINPLTRARRVLIGNAVLPG